LQIHEIAEKSPQQGFEGNMKMSAVITLQELLTQCQTITFIMNCSDKLAMTTHCFHQLQKIGVEFSGKPFY
jgi:hypothetical protein